MAALLEVRRKRNEYEKQRQRKRRDAARRGDASALAALQNYRLKAKEYQRKRRDALRKRAVVDVELREAGKDGKQTKFRGVVALKGDCKVAQSRLCQASPENTQEHSVPEADDVDKMKDVDNMDAWKLRAFAKSLGVEIR